MLRGSSKNNRQLRGKKHLRASSSSLIDGVCEEQLQTHAALLLQILEVLMNFLLTNGDWLHEKASCTEAIRQAAAKPFTQTIFDVNLTYTV